MDKYYYDTSVFGYFFFKREWKNQYSPTKIKGYKSVFCDQELLHTYMNGHWNKWIGDSKFLDISEGMLFINAFFQQADLGLNEIRVKFINMMGSLAQNGVNITEDLKRYNKTKIALKPVGGMDWLHLAVADLFGCNIILTTDKDFKYLSKVSKFLKLNNIERIIILSSDNKLNKLEEVNL